MGILGCKAYMDILGMEVTLFGSRTARTGVALRFEPWKGVRKIYSVYW